jgi:Arc/MetJ family transcription regulator
LGLRRYGLGWDLNHSFKGAASENSERSETKKSHAAPARRQAGVTTLDLIHDGRCVIDCGNSHMAINLSLDPKLVEQALQVSGVRTKKAAVTLALQEFIAHRRQKRLLKLMGKLEWDRSLQKGVRARLTVFVNPAFAQRGIRHRLELLNADKDFHNGAKPCPLRLR